MQVRKMPPCLKIADQTSITVQVCLVEGILDYFFFFRIFQLWNASMENLPFSDANMPI